MSEHRADHLVHLACLLARVPADKTDFYRSTQSGHVHVTVDEQTMLVLHMGKFAMRCLLQTFNNRRGTLLLWNGELGNLCIDELHLVFVLEALADV